MDKKKYYPSIAVMALLGLFIVQNIASVEVNILFWSVYAPRSLIFILIFLAGAAAGYLLAKRPKKDAEHR